MSGFVLHPSALTDLDEIWDFIAADNLTAADRVLEELFEVMSSLASFPRMGHSPGTHIAAAAFSSGPQSRACLCSR